MAFQKGKELCRDFYREAVKPILDRNFPGLRYSAGLLGYGSDVLGYDDPVSTDHMWGPRLYLFLAEEEMGKKGDVWDALCAELPGEFGGHSVHFSEPDPDDNGVRHPEPAPAGRVNPLIWIYTPRGFLQSYLGDGEPEKWDCAGWLACSEHRLLAVSAGELYRDGLGMEALLQTLRFYPETVRVYLMASNWAALSEEQAFLRRCGDRGDEIGSRLVCGRMAERLMRVCFLCCGRYAPYSKWFGTAFSRLPIGPEIGAAIREALAAEDLDKREDAMVRAQLLTAALQDRTGVIPPLNLKETGYFGRKIRVIYADRMACALAEKLRGTELEDAAFFGSMSEAANLTALYDNPAMREKIAALYRPD